MFLVKAFYRIYGPLKTALLKLIFGPFLSRAELNLLLYDASGKKPTLKTLAADFESLQQQLHLFRNQINLMDGKFNHALYGMPGPQNLKSALLTNSLAGHLPACETVQTWLENHCADCIPDRKAAALRIQSRLEELRNRNLESRSFLFCGLDLADDLRCALSSFTNAERLVLCDLFEPTIKKWRDKPAAACQELALSDPLTVLIAQGQRTFDLIVLAYRYQMLSSLDQIYVLYMAYQKLNEGGSLYIEVPSDAPQAEIQTRYWEHPYHFRPYSLPVLVKFLRDLGAEVQIHEADPSANGIPRTFLISSVKTRKASPVLHHAAENDCY